MPATSAPVILTGSFPQSLGLSFLSQQQCPQASNYCNTISLLSSQLTRAFFASACHDCLSFKQRGLGWETSSYLSVIFIPPLRSCLASEEISAVKGIKLSPSVYLHPLCVYQTAGLTAVMLIVSVSQARLLSVSKATMLAA